MKAENENRFFSWPLWVILAVGILVVFVFPFVGILDVLLLPIIAIAVFGSVVGLLRSSLRRQWRRAASMLALLLFCFCFVFAQSFVARTLGRASNVFHLIVEHSAIEARLSQYASLEKPVDVADWSSFSIARTFVIYDKSGRIAYPKDDLIWSSLDMKDMIDCAGKVAPIWGAYYRCDF